MLYVGHLHFSGCISLIFLHFPCPVSPGGFPVVATAVIVVIAVAVRVLRMIACRAIIFVAKLNILELVEVLIGPAKQFVQRQSACKKRGEEITNPNCEEKKCSFHSAVKTDIQVDKKYNAHLLHGSQYWAAECWSKYCFVKGSCFG